MSQLLIDSGTCFRQGWIQASVQWQEFVHSGGYQADSVPQPKVSLAHTGGLFLTKSLQSAFPGCHELTPGRGLGTKPHRLKALLPPPPPPNISLPLGSQHPGEFYSHDLEQRK